MRRNYYLLSFLALASTFLCLWPVNSRGDSGSNEPISPVLFGISLNNTTYPFPSVPFGIQRIWDTGIVQWPDINISTGTYHWDALDVLLGAMKSHHVLEGFYTLSRTPQWASSNPSDITCNYYGIGGVFTGDGAPGQCEPPYDLKADGAGTDQVWRDWVAAIAVHTNDPTFLQTHAHIHYWEIWNEFERSSILANQTFDFSYQGTYAQLVRMTEDASCIITGRVQKITATGESCQQVQSTVRLSRPVDPGALIVMPSGHVETIGWLAASRNFLYCNGVGKFAPKPGSECITGDAGAKAVDAINFHMKVPTHLTEYFAVMMSSAQSVLQPAELKKPFINGESGFGVVQPGYLWSDPDMQASYVGRYYLLQASLGVFNSNWYTWDEPDNGLWSPTTGITLAGVAYGQVYSWMVGATMPAPGCSVNGTIWTCPLTRPGGYMGLTVWDTSESCNNGVCTTHPFKVGPIYTQYRDLYGNTKWIRNGTVPIGIKPILVEATGQYPPPY